jgi:hypothetical protein
MKFTGRLPRSATLLTVKSNGAVHVYSASQLAVASNTAPTASPRPML